MLKVYNDTSRYVDQGGRRKGAFAIYLEPWHPDIYEFLQLRKNNGTEENRARDLFYALWIPDLFMNTFHMHVKISFYITLCNWKKRYESSNRTRLRSIRSSPRYGLSTPKILIIRKSASPFFYKSLRAFPTLYFFD